MAYIPPHKRSLKGREKELHQESLSPNFDPRTKLKKEIIYAESSIIRCFPVGLMENGDFPCSVTLETYEFECDEYRKNQKSFVLHRTGQATRDHDGTMTCPEWRYISEKIQYDVLIAVKTVRNFIESNSFSTLKPIFVARVGKVIFHSKQSINLEKIKESFLNEFDHKIGVKKFFHTAVTNAYINFVEKKVVQDNEIALKPAKDQYVLKIEVNPLRHLVVDLACIFEDHDLRIMLTTKQIVESLTAEDKCSIMGIIESAVVDSNVKGGLRWPLVKESAGDKFRVQQVFHIVSKSFVCPMMRVKLRSADRFSLENSLGELACEVNMKLTGLSNHLKGVALLSEARTLERHLYLFYIRQTDHRMILYPYVSIIMVLHWFLLGESTYEKCIASCLVNPLMRRESGSDESTRETLQEVLKLIWEKFIHCKS